MRTAGLIVAAGRGQRLGGETPEAVPAARPARGAAARRSRPSSPIPPSTSFRSSSTPTTARSTTAALAGLADARLLPPVAGGASRAGSVLAGLEALAPAAPDRVLIHDAARPFLRPGLIAAVLAALDAAPAALPALPVVDALWRAADGLATAPGPARRPLAGADPAGLPLRRRSSPRTAPAPATPPTTRRSPAPPASRSRLVPGDEANFKITTAADLDRARARIGEAMDIRTGNGFDVHAFGPGDGVTLCGVAIPFDRGLVGHSDADVGMHALTDAIFGALAEGDIGQWFPPSDPAWKGAASEIFLRKAVERAAGRGFAVTHLDCTLVCEAPKIGPHAAAMRAALGRIAGIEPERISVKATTSERLGFTGRGEGIAALATATLVRP